MENMPKSIGRVDHQELKFKKTLSGRGNYIEASVRWDDRCKNGPNTFSVTGTVYRNNKDHECGSIQDQIAKHFPYLRKFFKWHLVSSDGPLHYIADSLYWAKKGNLKSARSCAIWPEAKLEDFTEEKLMARLPALMMEFVQDLLELGLKF